MSNLLDPETTPSRLVAMPRQYPNLFDAKRAALEAAVMVPNGNVEELLDNALAIMRWLAPELLPPTPATSPEPQNQAQEAPTGPGGTQAPPRG